MARSRSADGIGEIRLLQHLLDFVGGEHVLRQRMPSRGSSISEAGLCRMWFCRVIHRNHMRNGTSRDVLAAEGQRLAVLLAVVEQVPLIAFQHGPRDLDRLGQAALAGTSRETLRDGRAVCIVLSE